MSRSWTVGIVAVLALAAGTLTGAPALAQSKSNAASDVGVTASTIKVAVVADVDNSIVPGVLQGIVDGVNGWGKYVNANGGIAGRKVQVDFIDSKLNANDARNAIIKACAEDFALVGTGALLLQTVDDETSCPDSTGAKTGLPDIAAIATSQAEACAASVVPDRAELGGLRHREQLTADVPPLQRRLEVPVEEERQSARLVRARRRLALGCQDVQPAEQGGAAGRHQGGPRVAGDRVLTPERVHADHRGDEERRVELRAQPPSRDRRRARAEGSAAPGADRPQDRLGVHAGLLLRQDVHGGRRRGERSSTCLWGSCRSPRRVPTR